MSKAGRFGRRRVEIALILPNGASDCKELFSFRRDFIPFRSLRKSNVERLKNKDAKSRTSATLAAAAKLRYN